MIFIDLDKLYIYLFYKIKGNTFYQSKWSSRTVEALERWWYRKIFKTID